MTIPKKPIWIAFNAWVSLVILLGGYLLGTLHQDKPSYYCQGIHCVRVLPGEDNQAVYLEQIITERRLKQ
jgi:hypothetical protein